MLCVGRVPRSAGPVRRWTCIRGAKHTSIAFTERLAEAGIQPSVGAVGSSFDNALAETINGLCKTELIKPRGPWRSIDHVELATAEWVDWFNHRRLYRYRGDLPPDRDGGRPLLSTTSQATRRAVTPISLRTHRADSPAQISKIVDCACYPAQLRAAARTVYQPTSIVSSQF